MEIRDPQLGAVCAHCGEPVRDRYTLAASVDDGLAFCCAGCRSVYELLQSHDMCDYYAIAPDAGISQRAITRSDDEYAVLDDANTRRPFVEWTVGTTARLRFQIPTMHCASCVWLLDQLHRFEPGILASSVDFIHKSVSVDYNTQTIAPSEIAKMLARLGYEPLLRVEGNEGVREAARRTSLRALYMRIGVAGFAFGNVMMFSVATYFAGGVQGLPDDLRTLFPITSVLLALPVLVYSAQPWFANALAGLRTVFLHRGGVRAWNLDIPVALGMLALFVRSVVDMVMGGGEGFLDSFTGLVFFLLIGRLLLHKTYDAISFDRTYRSFFPLSVRREHKGDVEIVPIARIEAGDVLHVRNAEVVPSDCVLLDVVAYVDYAFVTGESRPVECMQGQLVHAGGRIVGKAARMSATKDASHAYLASLWERSGSHNARSTYEHLSDRFGLYFTLTTLLIAGIAFTVWLPDAGMALSVVAAVLIIACPCALTVAAPVTFGSAMSWLGKRGIFIRSPHTIAELLDVDVLAFDKTGTLTTTHGELDVSQMHVSADEWSMVQSLASHSTHPVSRSIAGTAATIAGSIADTTAGTIHSTTTGTISSTTGGTTRGATMLTQDHDVQVVEEFPGLGIRGIVNGLPILIGSAEFVGADDAAITGTHIRVDGRHAGIVRQRPVLRAGLDVLCGKQEAVLISGDSPQDAELFEPIFGENMWFNQRPTDKVQRIEELQSCHKRLLMTGDGLNDASALSAADVSIAVTNNTSTLAPASDVVMSAQNLQSIPALLSYARHMRMVVWASFIFTVLYNIVGLTFAVTGVLTPVVTAILMPISNMIVIGISVGGARYFYRKESWA